MVTTTAKAPHLEGTDSERYMHGAHLGCQEDAEFVVLVCGIAAGWDERDEGSKKPRCPKCNDGRPCPLCGDRLLRSN